MANEIVAAAGVDADAVAGRPRSHGGEGSPSLRGAAVRVPQHRRGTVRASFGGIAGDVVRRRPQGGTR